MSLSSFLLGAAAGKSSSKGKAKVIDEGLDALFRTSQTSAATPAFARPPASSALQPPETFLTSSAKDYSKRKRRDNGIDANAASTSETSHKKSRVETKRPPTTANLDGTPSPRKNKSIASKAKTKRAEQIIKPAHAEDQSKDNADDNAGVEDAYLASHSHSDTRQNFQGDDRTDAIASHDSDNDEVEFDPSKLVHESISKGASKHAGSRKEKYVPPSETSEQRDARTIFIGNIPVEAMKSRPLQKQLKKHVLSSVPSAKIESIRFRSVAFQKPTTKLPNSDDESPKSSSDPKAKELQEKKGRAHDRERAAHWRETKDAEDDADVRKDEKKFLSTAEKKKVAFIRGELHPTADSANAYLVFAHPRPGPLPTGQELVLDPHEAARLAVERCDATIFMERTIRVDRVGKKPLTAGDHSAGATVAGDPKRTLFVGNLDFASKEEDLRAFFEGLVAAERGPPPIPAEESEEDDPDQASAGTTRRSAWVRRVRIIRDKETQLGKGFAYVQFVDRECVDEILAMSQDKVKFAKRKLRVQRCKTLPGGTAVPRLSKVANAIRPQPSPSQPRARTVKPSAPIVVPKGDPALGAKLANMSKDERKEAKATDADRVARRMAKKQAKVAMAKSPRGGLAEDNARIRKRPGMKKGPGAARKETKKRVMSDKGIAKRNMKK